MVRYLSASMKLSIPLLAALGMASAASARKRGKSGKASKYFRRVSTFPVCSQIDPTCDDDDETAAEIVVVTDDGMTAVYTDLATESLGLVDIADARNPAAMGTIPLDGEPTSVALKGGLALVAVNTSPDFVDTSGALKVIDVESRAEVASHDLGGQPDSVAVSPDGNWAAVAIENERDEDLSVSGSGDGEIPQAPAGYVVIMDLRSPDPRDWTRHDVDITGLDGVLEDGDPEPENVSINEDNVAVVTLQENNAIVLIDVETRDVVASFTAGSVDLFNVDTEDNGVIDQTDTLLDVPREPDGVVWIGKDYFATSNEGDMSGGSRGFSIYDKAGNVVYESGSTAEHLITSFGHYPEKRSDNKGVEFENIAYAEDLDMLFVGSERGSVIMVYDVSNVEKPRFHQVLPAGFAPEGGYYIESRGIYIQACEKDSRDDKYRSSIVLYEYGKERPNYPTITSVEDEGIGNGVPIPWGALSGLSAGPSSRRGKSAKSGKANNILYAVDNSFYERSRIFTIRTRNGRSARLISAMNIVDDDGVLASVAPYEEFSADELDDMINNDNTVNIDSEGIAAIEGGFWVASEGAGTVGSNKNPVESLNFLLRVDADTGVIQEVVTLPDEINDIQRRFGFKGVTTEGDYVVVAFQREWDDEPFVRLGLYHTVSQTWKFAQYTLDDPTSQNGGWTGLSDITSLGGGDFLVLERDNQSGPDAAIKRIYKIELGGLDAVADGDAVAKTLVEDILTKIAPGGMPMEKVDGLAVLGGDVWIVNDNDGVDDNSGETQLINLGDILH